MKIYGIRLIKGVMEDIRFSKNLNLKINTTGFVSVVRDESFTFPYAKGKPFFSFIFVTRGALEYFFNKDKKKLQLDSECALFIPKNYPYIATYLKNNTKIYILNFELDNEQLPEIFSKPILLNMPEINLIFNSITFSNMSNPLFLASKIYELLYHIDIPTITTPHKYKKLLPAIKEFQQFYFKNEKMSYYSELCGVSESCFRRLFKEYTGQAPIEYRNSIRIANLKRLLSSGEFKINEAAYLVGFNNMSFFYEVYNKYKE
jgi:AraC-like DNA-binding protein